MFCRSVVACITLLSFASGCGRSGPDSRVQRLVDYYVPGVKVGAPVTAEQKSRYHLEAVPLPGFGDTSYVGPDGVHVLAITVDPRGGSGDKAPVGSIALGLPTRGALRLVKARLERELGKPARDVCSESGRFLIWLTSNGHNVILVGTPGSWSPAAEGESDSLSTKDHSLQLNIDPMPLGEIKNQACTTG